MYLLIAATMAAALNGPLAGEDRNVCEVNWQAAHASGSPLGHDRFIAACLKGAPTVAAQLALPNPPRAEVSVPALSDAVPASLGSVSGCALSYPTAKDEEAGLTAYASLDADTVAQACTRPGGLPQGVR